MSTVFEMSEVFCCLSVPRDTCGDLEVSVDDLLELSTTSYKRFQLLTLEHFKHWLHRRQLL